jgi:hypothetical protein
MHLIHRCQQGFTTVTLMGTLMVGGLPGELEPLSAPLSAGSLSRVAMIKVGLRAFAARNLTNDKDAAVLENDVYVRVTTATDFQNGPRCI